MNGNEKHRTNFMILCFNKCEGNKLENRFRRYDRGNL